LKLVVGRSFAVSTGVQQGIATDGTHVFVQSTYELVKYDIEGRLIARSGKLTLHHGGIACHDGKVYAAASECCKEGTKVHRVLVYDAETLEKVAEHDIGEFFGVCAGAIAYYNGHFYVAESYFDNDHQDFIVEFDESFKRVAAYTIDFKCPYGIQGLDYLPDVGKFVVNSHGRAFYLIAPDFDSKTIEAGEAAFELQDVAYLEPGTCVVNDRRGLKVVFVGVVKDTESK